MLGIMGSRLNVLTSVPSRMSGRHSAPAPLARALCLVAVLLTIVLLPQIALGQENKSVVWADVDVTLTLREDGTFHITELNTIDFSGGPFRRGYREIPLARVEALENI